METGDYMIRLYKKLPQGVTLAVAVSGGVDSMVAATYLSRKHPIKVYHINHGTDYAGKAEDFVLDHFAKLNVPVRVSLEAPPVHRNREAWWRALIDNQFSLWYDQDKCPIVLGHHLEDAVETYLMSCVTGTPKHLGYYGPSNTIRPFILHTKKELIDYANKNNIPYVEDSSNYDRAYTRNKVRHDLIPVVETINPGIKTMVRNHLIKRREESN
jgi:tRNA(Ile)-lysidine synthase